MSSSTNTDNGLVCFTNCYLPLEDGTLAYRDLWIDSHSGQILDAQQTFYAARKRPTEVINLDGNILSPGFLDIQINGAYGFDFSIYNGNDEDYKTGLKMVAEKIVETGVTSLVPTLVTQESSLYPKLLSLLGPQTAPGSSNILGWHAEGPFIQVAKRGAHAQPFLKTASAGMESFEQVYGKENVSKDPSAGVRIITAAPELEGVMGSVSTLADNGIIFSIGHSIASSEMAASAVLNGANLITHLFNAMPQLHHRDPSIIGLLGAGGSQSTLPIPSETNPGTPNVSRKPSYANLKLNIIAEALEELPTPPSSPRSTSPNHKIPIVRKGQGRKRATPLRAGDDFARPFYGIIVDGIHSHPNSVRLAYTAHSEGCILVTDAMPMLDPHKPDGVYDWRDGKRLVKTGEKLYIEGTDTLAGSAVTLPTCIRNFSSFTNSTLAQAIVCATYNPARCLGIEAKKGTLRANADADLVILTKEGDVLETWVNGKQAWKKQ